MISNNEMNFLGRAKEIDPHFLELYERITGHNPIKFKNSINTIIIMTTYVICDKCGERFRSEIQISNLETNIVPDDNPQNCPHCGETILTGKGNMINE